MKILALEASTKYFGLAVCDGAKVLASRQVFLKKVLSSSIIPAIAAILKRSDIKLEQLDGFAVGLGPGSFTSLRVGLSTIKGLAMVLDIPVVGVCSLDALAANLPADERLICTICDARRNLVYAGLYRNRTGLKKESEYLLLGIPELLSRIKEDAIFVGDGIGLFREEIVRLSRQAGWRADFADEKVWAPQARQVAKLAYLKFEQKKFTDPDRITPIYLYSEDCQVGK